MTEQERLEQALQTRIRESSLRCPPPIPLSALTDLEKSKGLKIPPTLRRIYSRVANGRFGPGYGLIGVMNGHKSDYGDLFDTAEQISSDCLKVGVEWRVGLIPIIDWGCAKWTCVDPSDEVVWDSVELKLRCTGFTLVDFFSSWLSGDLMLPRSNDSVSNADPKQIVNPFNRQVMTIRGDPN